MNKLAVLVVVLLLTGCSNYGQLKFEAKLPKELKEVSGMAYLKDSTLWLVNDGGNPDKIYQIDMEGKILKDFKVKNAKNKDWEDLASDLDGNVYIGDFGNNNNRRENLVIYKIPNPETEKGDKIDARKIKFSYPDQRNFPPKKEELKFDAEALFYREGYLFVITKNRSVPFSGEASVYRIPAEEGEYRAKKIAEFTPCREAFTCQITSADISPSGTRIVLLSYGKLWVFEDFDEEDFTKGKLRYIDLGATTQLESVCFLDETTLMLSDEKKGVTGRNLYSFSLGEK